MDIKTYNIIMGIATAIAWLGFFVIINNFDPSQASLAIFILFYFLLFLSILGSLSLLIFWIRKLVHRRRVLTRILITESFRQSIIYSSIFIVAFLLQSGRVLTWWNTLLLIILASIIEFSIIVFRKENNTLES